MSITDNDPAFVDPAAVSVGLSQMFTVTPAGSNPTYLVLTVLDRNEYTAGASGATGTLTGNGHTLGLGSIGGDGRGAGIVFTYQPSSGRYYNSVYGFLDQLQYNASGSFGDVTNLSLFGTNNLNLANSYASNAVSMMEVDAAGYLGSATVVTRPGTSGTVPGQATPNAIAATADSFVGKAWNMDGCWVLASTIAAESGTSLPVQSTLIGLPGQNNGEWIAAFNGPGGQSGNWQSLVHAGEMIVFQPAGGGGHITTCVSGSGSTAMLVDNITYINGSGQVQNSANDGSSADVTIAAPHAASQEFAGVNAATVVIYELDTPVVTDLVASDSLGVLGTQSLAVLFSAADPANKAIASWQVYDTAATDSLVFNGTAYSGHAAGSALTVASLSAVSLLAGATATTDTLEVRASNGSYWGDWQSLAVSIVAAAASAPVLQTQTASQTWLGGKAIALPLPASTFNDPQNQALTYAATLANGQALPGWLVFNAATDSFGGTAPTTAQALSIKVTATDSSGLSAADTFTATVIGTPTVTKQTPNQTVYEGKTFALTLPANSFTDPQGQALAYTASLANGQALPSWLTFHAASDSFTGTAPNAAQSVSVAVTATDISGLTATDRFAIAVTAPAPVVTVQTPNQTWTEGRTFSLALPASTFTDPQGQALTYTATQANGQGLPGWLTFNARTDTFSGTAPNAAQTVGIKVTATDTGGLSASESFSATVQAPAPSRSGITVTDPTPDQTWTDGQAVTFTLPANTFTDALGLKMSFAAYELSGPNVTSWLHFNAHNDELFGTVPANATGTVQLAVIAMDPLFLTAADVFNVTFSQNASGHGTTPVAFAGAAQQPDPTHVAGLIAMPS